MTEQVVEQTPQETPQEGGVTEQLIDVGNRKMTTDDLVKSYRELEDKFTKTSQEAAELRKLKQEIDMRQMFTPQAQEQPQTQQVNANEQFWSNPVDVMRQQFEGLMDSKLDFVYSQNYEAQKSMFANDPLFKEYEQQIDYIAKQQYPELRKQPGIVGQLYKMVRGLTFDEEAFKRKTIEEYERSKASAAQNGIEGASPSPSSLTQRPTVELSDLEKRTAQNMRPDLKPEEAWQRYAAAKVRMKGVSNG